MVVRALQLWLADTPSAHNNSYNVSNGEPFHRMLKLQQQASAQDWHLCKQQSLCCLVGLMCAVA